MILRGPREMTAEGRSFASIYNYIWKAIIGMSLQAIKMLYQLISLSPFLQC